MTKRLLIIALFLILTFSFGNLFAAEEEAYIDGETEYVKFSTERRGFFAGGGPMLGFETNVLKSIGGGGAGQLGFRFNDTWAVGLQTGLLYTRDAKVDYLSIPVLPFVKMNFWNEVFGIFGAGYNYMWASSGRQFKRPVAVPSKSYNGWAITAGLGYDIWWSNNLTISPQIGIDYMRVASRNFVYPMVRINSNWMF